MQGGTVVEALVCDHRRNEESLWRADFFKDCLAAKDIRLKVRNKTASRCAKKHK